MRLPVLIWLVLILANTATGQDVRPEIIGQEVLSTNQGVPITIHLNDLIVKETPVPDNGGDDNGDGEDGGEENGGGDGNDNDDDGEGDSDDDDDGGNGSDSDDEDGGGNGGDSDDNNGNNEDDKDKEKDKDKDKEKDEDKESDKDKDKDKDKGKGENGGGNNRTGQYPDGYTLTVYPGANYGLSSATVQPDPAFTGVLAVDVSVSNGRYSSPRYTLIITVKPVNASPVITGQVPLQTTVGTPVEIRLEDLQVSDPDDAYPQGFSLRALPGENYTVNGKTVLPQANFVGVLTVSVIVNDGTTDSAPYPLKVQVADIVAVAPVITGQIPLHVSKNQSLTIVLAYIRVVDPDSDYPSDFSLKIFTGQNYSVKGAVVTPDPGFTGELSVQVAVHDGQNESERYPLIVTVMPGQNHTPVITGQAGLKIPEGETLQLRLSHLVVDDPDNVYPEDFSLQIADGAHYTVAGNVITPEDGFLGMMHVAVTVSDGKSTSERFALQVQVIPGNRLEITGQVALEIPEDSSFVIGLSDLHVSDPSDLYPKDFSLQIMGGENYDVDNGRITPHRNFFGNLTVPVTVSRDGKVSAPFSMLVIVTPVNDAPELLNMESDPSLVNGTGPYNIFPGVEVTDVDDDHLLFAEAGFEGQTFQPGIDKLLFQPTENIHGVFDGESGILFLLGRATLEEYTTLLRSVQYTYSDPGDSILLAGARNVYLKLNDGKETSPVYVRTLLLETDLVLDIPTAFTPNNDQANDTWKIMPLQAIEQLSAFVRVYDKRGNIVFESADLEREWDGHFNGAPLPADVYFYTIQMDFSYRQVSYKGIVSILR